MRKACKLCAEFTPHVHEERWRDVTPRQSPKVIGVGFFADLCGDWQWDNAIVDGECPGIVERIRACPQHVFVSVTQRPDRLPDIDYPDNWWWGTTVRNQAEADERIGELMAAPVKRRWVSYEPALGPVNFPRDAWLVDVALGGLDLVVVGGESGPQARPLHPRWARVLRDECAGAGGCLSRGDPVGASLAAVLFACSKYKQEAGPEFAIPHEIEGCACGRGNAGFHVRSAATVDSAVPNLTAERIVRPGGRAQGDGVDVAGHGDWRFVGTARKAGDEGRPAFSKSMENGFKAGFPEKGIEKFGAC